MTQTPFKAYQAKVGFDPIQDAGSSLIQSAESNQNTLLEAQARRNAELFKYELADAERKDNRFNKLAQLSQTAASIAAPILQAQTNEARLEGEMLWKTDQANNQEAQQLQFDLDEKQLLTEELINNEIVDEAEAKGEIDPWLKDRLKKLPRNQRYGYQKAMYQQEAKMYPLYREQNKTIPVRIQDSNGQWVDRALEDAKDPNEWNQINGRLMRGYMRPFAGEGHSSPMLKKYLYNEMNKIEEDEFKQWSTFKIKQITDDNNLKTDNTLKNDFSKNPNSVMDYALKEQSRYGSIAKAHDAAIGILEEEINLNMVNSDDVIALGNSTYIDKTTGKEYLYKDRFPRKMAILEQALFERDKKDFQKKQTQQTIEKDKFDTEQLNKLIQMFEDEEEITNDLIDDMQLERVKIYGQRSPKLAQIKQDLTVEAKDLERETKKAEALADLGLLDNTRLAGFNWQVQRKFRDIAQIQTEVNTEGKQYLGYIEQLVKTDAKFLPDGSAHYSVGMLSDQLKIRFRQLAIEAKQAALKNPDGTAVDPYVHAFSVIQQEFDKLNKTPEQGGIKTHRGYDMGLPKANQISTTSIQVNQAKQETDSFILAGPKSLDEQDTFFSVVEISDALKGYGEVGWQPHPKAVYIAEQYNIDPLAVLQRQAKAYDPKADLQEPPSVKAFNEKVDKYSKKLILTDSPTYSGVSRGWGSTGEVNYYIFKNAEQSKQIGEEIGLPDFVVEAAAELGFLQREDPLDEDEQRNFYQAIWKMSGGTDTRALQELTRPTFKP